MSKQTNSADTSAHTATPMAANGSVIFLANGIGGFDVRGCPNAKELASLIVRACNAHDDLVNMVRQLKATVNMSRMIMNSQEARDIAGDLVEEANTVLAKATK